jgi:mono/diheme cytochrome c family protein
MRVWTTVVAALCTVLAYSDVAGADERLDRLRETARKLAGRDHYQAHCATCHGTTGTGSAMQPAIRDFTSPAAVAELSREDMIAAVGGAHAQAVSARWQGTLGDDAIAGVVDYIREAFMVPAPVADASLGRKIYARTCSVCHGERGDSASWSQDSLDPPPRDFTATEAKALSRQQMINAVTYGSPQTAMMPFASQLSREQIAAVVEYIRTTFMTAGDEPDAPATEHSEVAGMPSQDHGAAAASAPGGHAQHGHGDHGGVVDMAAPLPDGLVGDRRWGKTFYEANCVACHGMKGDGNGPRAYFMSRKPKDFTSGRARAELNRPHLFAAVRLGVVRTEMPAWSKVLNDQEIANLAEYLFIAFIRPEHADAPHGHEAQGHETHGHETHIKKNP